MLYAFPDAAEPSQTLHLTGTLEPIPAAEGLVGSSEDEDSISKQILNDPKQSEPLDGRRTNSSEASAPPENRYGDRRAELLAEETALPLSLRTNHPPVHKDTTLFGCSGS